MKRRDFVAASVAGLTSLGALAQTGAAESSAAKQKEFYELKTVKLKNAAQQERLLEFLGGAAIPAYNRIGVGPVGVFSQDDEKSFDVTVLLPHKTVESAITARHQLLADDTFMKDGASFLDATKADPAYQRIESSLLLAFDGIPKLEVPSKSDSRIFRLRIYESRSMIIGQRKIHMFNEGGEIALFRKTGLKPVFFGEAIIGTKIPNLTYMVGFDDADSGKAAWKQFIDHPEWKKLSANPYYKDTVSNITNIFMRPAACSQI